MGEPRTSDHLFILVLKKIITLTLIIYAHYKDGIVIISDRLESGTGVSQNAKKYHISNNKDYVLGMSGTSDVIISLLGQITRDLTINASNVVVKIETIARGNAPLFLGGNIVEGFILVKNGSAFEFFSLEIKPPQPIIGPAVTEFRCFGDPEARGIANNFLPKINLRDVELNDACQYLVAIMLEAANTVNSVGGINRGYDILVITNDGELLECSPYTSADNSQISTSFKSDGAKNFARHLQNLTPVSTEVAQE